MPKATAASTTPVVFEKGGVVMTDSRALAEFVGKRHDNVLRDIDALLAHSSDLRDVWFHEVSVPHPTIPGRRDRAFNMTRDGMVLAIGSYTGANATKFKVAYIRRFNEMEAALTKPMTIRQHRRALPGGQLALPAPEMTQEPFAGNLDLLQDLKAAVSTARVRVMLNETEDLGLALEEVLVDRIKVLKGALPSGKTMLDWDLRRTGGERNSYRHLVSKVPA